MRDPKRIDEVLKCIETIWKKWPDLRLCQLLGNLNLPDDPYYVEDDRLLNELRSTYSDALVNDNNEES